MATLPFEEAPRLSAIGTDNDLVTPLLKSLQENAARNSIIFGNKDSHANARRNLNPQ